MSNNELFYLQRIAEATERIGTQLQRLADQLCEDVAKVLAPEENPHPTRGELLESAGALRRTATVSSVLSRPFNSPPTPGERAEATGVQGLMAMADDLPPAAVPEPAAPVTKEMVVAALNMCARKHGIDAGKRVLNLFAPRLDEVPAGKYADLVATLEALG